MKIATYNINGINGGIEPSNIVGSNKTTKNPLLCGFFGLLKLTFGGAGGNPILP